MSGRKVKLKKSYAKWHLDHPDIYFWPSGIADDSYEVETLIHLMCCMGVPVYGRILKYNYDCAKVEFKVARLKMFYWVERHHVELLKD